MKGSLAKSNRWLKGILKIILILVLFVPAGLGSTVTSEGSGKLKIEQIFLNRKHQQRGYRFHHCLKILFNDSRNNNTYPNQLICFELLESNQLKNRRIVFFTFKDIVIQRQLSGVVNTRDEVERVM